MKIVVCVLALVLTAEASPVSSDFGSSVTNFFRKLRDQMPCGIKGSKPLAPFLMEDKIGEDSLKFNSKGFELQFDLTKVKIDGLDTFEIKDSVYEKRSKNYTVKFTLPKVNLIANYSIWSKFETELLDAKFVNNGSFYWDIKDKEEYGISFYFNNNKTTGDLIVENFKFIDQDKGLDLPLGGDKELEKEVKELLKELDKEVSDVYNYYFTNKINKYLVGKKTVEELTDFFNEMAGDSEHGPFGEPRCNHV